MPTPHPAAAKIKHVFVLMLENRSFDHMFGKSGIPGIKVATAAHVNNHLGVPIAWGGGAPERMDTDPAHEFDSVCEQLCGPGKVFPQGGPYPPLKNTGFAANYHKTFKTPPAAGATAVKAVMQAIDPAVQSPALLALAKAFAVCDGWHASLPGATWPNRFFVHGASSDGLDHSPTQFDIGIWEAQAGNFHYPNGSIYDRLGKANCRLYQDKIGPQFGQIPQVAALKNVNLSEVHPLKSFEADLAKPYPFGYTFIEPAYGNIVSGSYQGGNSQHPMDGLASGDRLVARVYNAIRNSPVWNESLLIVTYDEHGGFFDHVPPPKAVPPGDAFNPGHNKHGFDFSMLGVRVPAVVISPWIKAGTVHSKVLDHSSVPATLCRLFGKDPLTNRDKNAKDVLELVSTTLRTDCPTSVAGPPIPLTEAVAIEEPVPEGEPIEAGSQLQGFLFVAQKAEKRRLATKKKKAGLLVEEVAEVATPEPLPDTTAEAKRYLERVLPKVQPKK